MNYKLSTLAGFAELEMDAHEKRCAVMSLTRYFDDLGDDDILQFEMKKHCERVIFIIVKGGHIVLTKEEVEAIAYALFNERKRLLATHYYMIARKMK